MRQRGFSLIEVVVVMGIISVLFALLLPALQATKEQSQQTVCVSNLRQLGLASEMYKADQGEYPFINNAAFDSYVAGTRLRCEKNRASFAYNFSTYRNLAFIPLDFGDESMKNYAAKLKECREIRGPEYPNILDLNHLPNLVRPDNLLPGEVLIYRASGAVKTLPRQRYAEIELAFLGAKKPDSLPCHPDAQLGNL